MKIAAIYARVSGERQRNDNTIASQTEALIAYAEGLDCSVAPDMIIEDDGYSGAVLERPGSSGSGISPRKGASTRCWSTLRTV